MVTSSLFIWLMFLDNLVFDLSLILPQAAGLIFVVDALEFLPNCRAAAEYLYDIPTKACVVKRKIPLLIVCNKTEEVTAHSKEFVCKQLEKEIEKIRASRTGASDADIQGGRLYQRTCIALNVCRTLFS